MTDTLSPQELAGILRVGQTVLFFPDPSRDHRDSRKAHVQGWRAGQFVNLDLVLDSQRSIILRQGGNSSVRFVHDGRIHAFTTVCLDNRADQRDPGIRVSWPESINVLQLRKHQRVGVLLKAQADIGGTVVDGSIDDLSVGGIRICVPVAVEQGATFRCRFVLTDGTEVEGTTCEVKNVERTKEGCTAGCMFQNLPEQARNDIEFFISMTVAAARADEEPVKVLFIGSGFSDIQEFLDLLRGDGKIVTTASGAIEGFAKLRSFRPNVLFLGSQQTDLDADQMFKIIRQTPTFERLPILSYGGAPPAVSVRSQPDIDGHLPSLRDTANAAKELSRVLQPGQEAALG